MREKGTAENEKKGLRKGDGGKFSLLRKRDGPQYLEGPSLFLKSENFPPSPFLSPFFSFSAVPFSRIFYSELLGFSASIFPAILFYCNFFRWTKRTFNFYSFFIILSSLATINLRNLHTYTSLYLNLKTRRFLL